MTRVIAVSDSHGAADSLRWVLTHEKADALIYLGDGLRDLDEAMDAKPKGMRVDRARGNCDFGYPDEPVQALCAFGGVLFFYTHGHHYGVKSGVYQIMEAGEERLADVEIGRASCRERV